MITTKIWTEDWNNINLELQSINLLKYRYFKSLNNPILVGIGPVNTLATSSGFKTETNKKEQVLSVVGTGVECHIITTEFWSDDWNHYLALILSLPQSINLHKLSLVKAVIVPNSFGIGPVNTLWSNSGLKTEIKRNRCWVSYYNDENLDWWLKAFFDIEIGTSIHQLTQCKGSQTCH